MGLDVYVGTLTRYFTGDWELITQSVGRELGLEVEVMRPVDPPDAITDPNEVRGMLVDWQDVMGPVLGIDAHWDERDGQPYFTDKPTWDGYWGMRFLAGNVEKPEVSLPDVWPDQPDRHPLVTAPRKRLGVLRRKSPPEVTGRFWSVHIPTLWLPWPEGVMWHGEFLNGEVLTVGSVNDLARQLQDLASDLEADADLASWESRGPGYEGGEPDGGPLVSNRRGSPLVEGRRGLAMFHRLAHLAAEHRLPLRLDF